VTDKPIKKVFVTGGAGYVGAVMVPRLLALGYKVKVIDLYLFGEVFKEHKYNPNLEEVHGDIRDQAVLKRELPGCDAVIHLACISNDPSFELDPKLGKTINFDAFEPLVDIAKASGVSRFIYASSSSVYGVSEIPNVDETHPLKPLTDYSKFKAMCEPILLARQSPDFTTVVIRPATVCGYSPRQRLDLAVNILTNLAVNNGKITVFGGSQLRPNIHIQDMSSAYELLLSLPSARIAGRTFNAGFQNYSVADIANIVKDVVEQELPGRAPVQIVTSSSNDLRSYHINSDLIRKELGFTTKFTIQDAVRDLVKAFNAGKLPNSLTDPTYFNIKVMQNKSMA
jgi:nucleoside-diphosphate-sugar epimerase